MVRFIRKTVAVLAVAGAAFVFQGCGGEDNPAVNNPDDGGDGGKPVVVAPPANVSADSLINLGNLALQKEKFDQAVAYYEAAYQKDPGNIGAVVTSSMAKIASISVDPKVADLFKNHFGFKKYPSTFGALTNPESWMEKYKNVEYEYYDENLRKYVEWISQSDVDRWAREEGASKPGYYYWHCAPGDDCGYKLVSTNPRTEDTWLPGLLTPDWIYKGNKNSVYSQSLVGVNASPETFAILLFANLVNQNTTGLNSLLDDVISAVFGDNGPLAEATRRIATLKGKPGIMIDQDIIDRLNLDLELATDGGEIGWAELNVYVQLITGVKASLEWVAAYDWSTNLKALKDEWLTSDEYAYNRFKALDLDALPFKSKCLEARPGKMAAAKKDFIAMIDGLDESFKLMLVNDLYPSSVQAALPVVRDALGKFKSAIQNGGVFWILDPNSVTSPSGLKWPSADGPNVIAGYDMGNFFKEGYFSLPNLFETENRAPVFYTTKGEKLTKENYESLLQDAFLSWEEDWDYYEDGEEDGEYEERTYFGFKFKWSAVTNLVKLGQAAPDDSEVPSGDQILPMFPPEAAYLLFSKYNGLDLPDWSALSKKRTGKKGQVALSKTR